MKSQLMTSMFIGTTLLMMWYYIDILDVPLNVTLLLLGVTYLFVGLLFYIMVAVRENENDPRRIQ